MKNEGEESPPLGFSILTPLPGLNVGEIPPITVSMFTVKTLENTSLANHTTSSANPNPAISPAFIEANYEVLESLSKERRRQIGNEDLRTELEYYSEECDEEREMEPKPARIRETTLEEQCISSFVHGLKIRSLMEFLSTNLPTTYKGLIEKTYTWIKAKEVATNGAPNNRREGFKSFNKGPSWNNNKGKKKNGDMFSSYCGPNHRLLSNLSKSPREILATEKVTKTFEQPPRLVRSRRSRDIGTFLGHLITKKGIKYNPSKVKAISNLRPPKMVKEMQSLNEKLAALSQFLLKGVDKALPFFKILKNYKKRKQFSGQRTQRSFLRNERAHKGVTNAYSPNQRRSLGDISVSLNGKHKRRLTSRKRKKASFYLLRKQGVTRGRTKLSRAGKTLYTLQEGFEDDIEFRGRNSTKGQILANFLAETPFEENKETKAKKPVATDEELEPDNMWKLYTDRALSSDGFGAGLMLVDPEGKEYTYALRFEFETTDNKEEYGDLLAGLQIEVDMKVKKIIHPHRFLTSWQSGQGGLRSKTTGDPKKKADALSKLASMTFSLIAKEILDIYAAGSESRPPMLNKENYVPWSSRLLRYAKSRPNGKLIHNSILNGQYVGRMIPEPGDANRDVNVNKTFYEQTDDELSEKELKQIEADDQAIQTILLDRQMQMVGGNGGNQFRQYAGQNIGNLNGYNAVQNVKNQLPVINANSPACYEASRNKFILIILNDGHASLLGQMIPEPGDAERDVNVTETFYEQTDDELSEKELKQIEADDQAIQTILLDLPEDIYATEKKAKLFNEWERFTSNEGESIESYYHRFLKLMNDLKRNKHFPEKIASNLKFLNNLQPEWSRHVTIVHQTKYLHTADYTQLYDFLKNNQKEYNQKEVDELKAERLAKTQYPLALMANSNNPYTFSATHQDQSSFNQNYLQQPMPNPEDITDPTTAMNMELSLMAKAFKLNYSTPTNNNQRISSNPRNRQIAQSGIECWESGNGNQNQIGNGNLVAVRAKENAAGHNGNQIRCYNCRAIGHFARDYTVRPRRRDAAYLQTQLLIAQKEEGGIQL
uniref:CCHC-type domain-containing protein n=1 Tax=Tanacetum cinerariifolium TaxID=118510 RepID=A0A6L2NSL0_TANCI|nr:hypothetical protein [Tanacetum cinerariifolium]